MNAISLTVATLEAECRRHPLATLSEHYLKAHSAAKLLENGFAIIEGSNWSGQGWKVNLLAGKLVSELVPLPKRVAVSDDEQNSTDLRVVTPSGLLFIELQARCSVGSSSLLLSANVKNDIERVQTGFANAFILAADQDLYDSLRGVKKDNRGRKAKHPELFSKIFPPSVGLQSACDLGQPGVSHDGVETWASLICSDFDVQRVVAVVMKQRKASEEPL